MLILNVEFPELMVKVRALSDAIVVRLLLTISNLIYLLLEFIWRRRLVSQRYFLAALSCGSHVRKKLLLSDKNDILFI